jgi:hypothetical protein
MHWRTFGQLKADHDRLVNVSLAGIMKQIGVAEKMADQFE